MSYFQSQMHSDYDQAESSADSAVEDGELRKVQASPLYLQNREDYESSRMSTATAKPAALFSFGMKNQEINSRVLFTETLTVLEGN